MERHTRLSRAAVVLVAIALIASIAAAVWFASPDAPYVPNEDSGAALGTVEPAEDGTVAGGYQPSGTGISDEAGFIAARTNGGTSYYLKNDITITSLHDTSDYSNDQVYGGVFDGAGHTITIDASKTSTNSDVGGMFTMPPEETSRSTTSNLSWNVQAASMTLMCTKAMKAPIRRSILVV